MLQDFLEVKDCQQCAYLGGCRIRGPPLGEHLLVRGHYELDLGALHVRSLRPGRRSHRHPGLTRRRRAGSLGQPDGGSTMRSQDRIIYRADQQRNCWQSRAVVARAWGASRHQVELWRLSHHCQIKQPVATKMITITKSTGSIRVPPASVGL